MEKALESKRDESRRYLEKAISNASDLCENIKNAWQVLESCEALTLSHALNDADKLSDTLVDALDSLNKRGAID